MGTEDWRESLSDRDEAVLRGCLRAAVDGPFFDEWEFQLLFGLERDEVKAVLATWPETDNPQDQLHAVLGAMNQLLGYPHGCDDVWSDFIPASREELRLLSGRIWEAIGLNDAARDALVGILASLAALDDEGLIREESTVREVVDLARQNGVSIPERLERARTDGPALGRDGTPPGR